MVFSALILCAAVWNLAENSVLAPPGQAMTSCDRKYPYAYFVAAKSSQCHYYRCWAGWMYLESCPPGTQLPVSYYQSMDSPCTQFLSGSCERTSSLPLYQSLPPYKESGNCLSSPCLNGGTCYDQPGGFWCSCPEGFYGSPTCEPTHDLREKSTVQLQKTVAVTTASVHTSGNCRSSPCLNGGTCYDQPGGFWCSCPKGFYGSPTCEPTHDLREKSTVQLQKTVAVTTATDRTSGQPSTATIHQTEAIVPLTLPPIHAQYSATTTRTITSSFVPSNSSTSPSTITLLPITAKQASVPASQSATSTPTSAPYSTAGTTIRRDSNAKTLSTIITPSTNAAFSSTYKLFMTQAPALTQIPITVQTPRTMQTTSTSKTSAVPSTATVVTAQTSTAEQNPTVSLTVAHTETTAGVEDTTFTDMVTTAEPTESIMESTITTSASKAVDHNAISQELSTASQGITVESATTKLSSTTLIPIITTHKTNAAQTNTTSWTPTLPQAQTSTEKTAAVQPTTPIPVETTSEGEGTTFTELVTTTESTAAAAEVLVTGVTPQAIDLSTVSPIRSNQSLSIITVSPTTQISNTTLIPTSVQKTAPAQINTTLRAPAGPQAQTSTEKTAAVQTSAPMTAETASEIEATTFTELVTTAEPTTAGADAAIKQVTPQAVDLSAIAPIKNSLSSSIDAVLQSLLSRSANSPGLGTLSPTTVTSGTAGKITTRPMVTSSPTTPSPVQLGDSCVSTEDTCSSIPNASCIFRLCQCKPGYINNGNGTCRSRTRL